MSESAKTVDFGAPADFGAHVGRSYRALARKKGEDYYWFWNGSHEAYNKLLRRVR